MHFYTGEQKEFIAKNVLGRGNVELTDSFNKHFNVSLEVNQIRAFKKKHKLSSGLDGRFKKGQAPHNKGKKKYWKGGEETRFKKGNKPYNYMPVGSVRINADDYVDIKIADPNKWKGKHILVWEDNNGPVPRGKCIIFGDRNNRNFNPDNLICVSRSELIVLNNKGLIQNDAELTKIGVGIARIELEIGKRRK